MGIKLELTGTDTTGFDSTEAATSRAVGIVAIITKTGNGVATIMISGDGHADVAIEYSVDGGGNVVIGQSDKKQIIVLSFATSLEIETNNTNAGAQNSSEFSVTGSMK